MKQTDNQKMLTFPNSKGFTLVETLVAIFILLLTITTMITLSTGSFYNVRYAQNQITANALAQEMTEYIRNTRDTAVQKDSTNGFANWVTMITPCVTSQLYCDLNQFTQTTSTSNPIRFFRESNPLFSKPQTLWKYPNGQFSTPSEYISGVDTGGGPTPSVFSRGIQFKIYSPEQVEAIVRIDWKNGLVDKTLQQSIILTKW